MKQHHSSNWGGARIPAPGKSNGPRPHTAHYKDGDRVIVQESIDGAPVMADDGHGSMIEATVRVVRRGLVEIELPGGRVWRIRIA